MRVCRIFCLKYVLLYLLLLCFSNAWAKTELYTVRPMTVYAPVEKLPPIYAGMATLLKYNERYMYLQQKPYNLLQISSPLEETFKYYAYSRLDFREEQFENEIQYLLQNYFQALAEELNNNAGANTETLSSQETESKRLQLALFYYTEKDDVMLATQKLLSNSFLCPKVRRQPFSLDVVKQLLKLQHPFLLVRGSDVAIGLAIKENNGKNKLFVHKISADGTIVDFDFSQAAELEKCNIFSDYNDVSLIYLPSFTPSTTQLERFIITAAQKINVFPIKRDEKVEEVKEK